MQLLTANGGQVEYRAEKRGANGALPWGNSVPPTNGQLGTSSAGVNVSEKSVLQIPAVYGAVRVIAGGTSTLPVHCYIGDGSVTDRRVTKNLSPLVDEPCAELDVLDFITQFVFSLALRGNFYGLIASRDKNFYPTQIVPQHPDNVQVRRYQSGPLRGQLEYRFNGETVANGDVVHSRHLSAPGSPVGLSMIQYQSTTCGTALGADNYAAAYYANSATPGGVIEVEEDLDEDEILSMADRWMEAHQGINKAQLPAVLSGGAKFSPISVNPEDAQLLESRQYSAGVVSGMIFGVPPHMIGIVDRTTSWGVGIEQQEMGFVRNTLIDYISRYERMISKLLPTSPNTYIRLDVTERLRGDTLQRFQAWALALGAGWLNKDEVRTEERRPPIPDGKGKTYYEPVNMTPLGQMGVGGSTTGAGPGGSVLVPNPMGPDPGAQKAPSGQ